MSHDLPDSAWEDLQSYKSNNVFAIADEGIDRYTANITLTKGRPLRSKNSLPKQTRMPTKSTRKNRKNPQNN